MNILYHWTNLLNIYLISDEKPTLIMHRMATSAPMELRILCFQIEFLPIAPNHFARVVSGGGAKEQLLVPGMLVRKNLKPQFATFQIISK